MIVIANAGAGIDPNITLDEFARPVVGTLKIPDLVNVEGKDTTQSPLGSS
jgi:hypothetical protein